MIDNLRTWCGALDLDTDSSSAAASAIDPIGLAVRDADYPVACTIVHNEARSKVSDSGYAGRMRNSTVFEDAADWIVGIAHETGRTDTEITSGEKTRRGIPTETLMINLDAGGRGTPETGGGGADPFTVGAPVNPLDAKITGYLDGSPRRGNFARDSAGGPGTCVSGRCPSQAGRGAWTRPVMETEWGTVSSR